MRHDTLSLFTILAVITLLATSSFGEDALPVVLFDQGHDQRFVIEETGDLQLSKLADAIRSQGAQVVSTKAILTDEKLTSVFSLVLSGPFTELSPEEVDAVIRFVERGGRLAVMLHIGPPLTGLLHRLEVDHSNSVLHERRNVLDIDINFIVWDLTTTPLLNGLEKFSAHGIWALKGGTGVTAIAHTSAEAWVDLNGDRRLSRGDMVGSYDVAVTGTAGAGSFTIFGDDAIFQNRYLVDDNVKLAANLGAWLAGH